MCNKALSSSQRANRQGQLPEAASTVLAFALNKVLLRRWATSPLSGREVVYQYNLYANHCAIQDSRGVKQECTSAVVLVTHTFHDRQVTFIECCCVLLIVNPKSTMWAVTVLSSTTMHRSPGMK